MKDARISYFVKLQAAGNDYILIDNMDGDIACPESLAVRLCEQHYGVGAEGMTLIEKSDVADARMRQFNRDGTEGGMGGNALRCVGKYLYDRGIVMGQDITVETVGGVKALHLFTRSGNRGSFSNLGPRVFRSRASTCSVNTTQWGLPMDTQVTVYAAPPISTGTLTARSPVRVQGTSFGSKEAGPMSTATEETLP